MSRAKDKKKTGKLRKTSFKTKKARLKVENREGRRSKRCMNSKKLREMDVFSFQTNCSSVCCCMCACVKMLACLSVSLHVLETQNCMFTLPVCQASLVNTADAEPAQSGPTHTQLRTHTIMHTYAAQTLSVLLSAGLYHRRLFVESIPATFV